LEKALDAFVKDKYKSDGYSGILLIIKNQIFVIMKLPKYVDLTPSGKIVPRAGIMEEGYGANIECVLELSYNESGDIEIRYYCEDDSYLNQSQIKYIFNNYQKLMNYTRPGFS